MRVPGEGDLEERGRPEEGPGILYHYTGAPGLIGILDKSSIWVSRASALNDPNEVTYGWDIVKAFVTERWMKICAERTQELSAYLYYFVAQDLELDLPDPSDAEDKKVVERLKRQKPLPEGAVLKRWDPFVASFCEKPDLLSQWNYYARDGGYSIGFRRDRLIDAERAPPFEDPAKATAKQKPAKPRDEGEKPFELCQVVYRPDNQRQLVANAGRRFEERLAMLVSGENQSHHLAGAQTAARCFVVAMGSLVCRMKAEGCVFRPS